MAAPLSLAPNDMAFATVPAHCSVPSVATGRSTSALTQATKAASARAAQTALLRAGTGQRRGAILGQNHPREFAAVHGRIYCLII